MDDLTAMLIWCVALWLAFFGMVAFGPRSEITRRSKQLGLLIFVAMVVDASRSIY